MKTSIKFRFNSNMVRLRLVGHPSCPVGVVFQFQYGAIKTAGRNLALVLVVLFQFQYGAIKTQQLPHQSSKPKKGFNSNMVRLRHVWLASMCSILQNVSIPIWCD